MIARMNDQRPYRQEESPFRQWWNNLNFIQRRLVRFGISMIVLGLCLPLYYLGFFGTVEGPLNPARIGQYLGHMGVSRTHASLFFLALLIFALTWNWIYNYASLLMGARLTCKKPDEEGRLCGARVERKKVAQKKTGKMIPQYVCAQGHKLPEAHFHPVQKGTFSHTLWVTALAFCVVVFFLS
jgi:hypothetical protein